MSKITNENEYEYMSPEEKREIRRQRRVRNQITAIVALVVILLVTILLLVFGIGFARKKLNEKKQQEIIQEQISSMEEAMEEVQEEPFEPEVVIEESPEDVLDDVVDACISEMTLEEKVAGLFVVTPEAITGVDTAVKAGDGTKTALEEYPVGGLIYFKKNIESESQLKEMIANSINYSKRPLFIAVDEEGGSVSRLADALKLENVGPMADIGSTGDSANSYQAMQKVGTYLTEYGFNLDFAPVADVLTNEKNTSIGDRSFGNDPAAVATMVTSAVNGLEEAGVTACVKHFPGLGAASEDTHKEVATVDKSLEELKETELVPFQTAIDGGAKMIMVGHISLPQIVSDNKPASMSKEIISDLLRSQMGFNGVVITDAMNMGAITEYYGADEAAIMALKAGADMVLMPEDFKLAYEGVLAAVKDGTISEDRINDSLTRVYRIKYADSVGSN